MAKFHEGLRVDHNIWGPGIVLHSEPLTVEFYRESVIKTFENDLGFIPKSVSQVDKFNLSDRVRHKKYGNGRVVQKNNITGEIVVLFNSVQDACMFKTFKLDTPELKKYILKEVVDNEES